MIALRCVAYSNFKDDCIILSLIEFQNAKINHLVLHTQTRYILSLIFVCYIISDLTVSTLCIIYRSQCARLELRVPRRNMLIYSLYIGRQICPFSRSHIVVAEFVILIIARELNLIDSIAK